MHPSELTRRDNLFAKQKPITLRRCLGCDYWMRSTGPDHRICNTCKDDQAGTFRVAGQRITMELTL